MSSSAILSDALSVLSKTTHQIIADVETRSRSEVARAVAEANEARHQRDQALKDLHASQLETEACKRESTVSKAQYAQAELTIVHHLETLTQQAETTAQLRREVNQWKDQSKNWQEHFLRVEQERCALSSRVDELVSERLAWSRNESNVYTPRSRYQDGLNSSAASAKRDNGIPSPTQLSNKNPPASVNKNEADSSVDPPKPLSISKPTKRPTKPSGSTSKRAAQQQQHASSSTVDSPLSHVKASSSQARQTDLAPSSDQQPTVRRSTVIRRVQAVIHVKREVSDEELDAQAEANEPQPVMEPKARRRRSRMIVEDEKEESEGSDADDNAAVARKLRPTRGAINYGESDYGESEEDELMIGNEDNRDEVFGSSRPNRRPKAQPASAPPAKKRKVTSTTLPR